LTSPPRGPTLSGFFATEDVVMVTIAVDVAVAAPSCSVVVASAVEPAVK
jgi:hypothetical protein